MKLTAWWKNVWIIMLGLQIGSHMLGIVGLRIVIIRLGGYQVGC